MERGSSNMRTVLLLAMAAVAVSGCSRSSIKAWSDDSELFHVESTRDVFSPAANGQIDLNGFAERTRRLPDGTIESSRVEFGRATVIDQGNQVPLAEIMSKTLLGALAGGVATGGNPAGAGLGAAAGAALGAIEEVTKESPPAPAVDIPAAGLRGEEIPGHGNHNGHGNSHSDHP